jgi:hypothetical protein
MVILRQRYCEFGCLFALFSEVILFYRGVLFSSTYGIPYDLDGYHHPLMGFIVAALRRGELPLWDPYTYCGVPFYANMQAQLFYPPAWPFYILGVMFPDHTYRLLVWQVAAHVFLAGLFTYWLLRRIGLGRGAALFGGTVFQLGGFFASQTQHLGAICGSAWLPLAWLGIVLLAERWSWRRLALLATAIAMATLAGYPATLAAVTGSTIVLALLMVAMRRARAGLLLSAAGGIVLGFLLSAVQTLPALQLGRVSHAAMRGGWTVFGGGVPLQSLVSMLLPDHYHIFEPEQFEKLHLPWDALYFYLYCGLAGLALGLAAVVWSKHKYRLVFAALTVISALWMFCDNTPVGRHLFPLLPAALKAGFYVEFAMAAFLLGFSVLAALGAQRFVAPLGPIALAALVVVTAFDLIHTGAETWMNRGKAPGVSYGSLDGSRATVERMRGLVNETVPPSRTDVIGASHNWVCAAGMLRVPTANGDDPVALWRLLKVRFCFANGDWWTRYIEVTTPESPLLDLLNIRFVLTRGAALPAGGDFISRGDLADGTRVYENRRVLPRFLVVNHVEASRDLEDSLRIMRSAGFDPARTAVVESPVLPAIDAAPARTAGSVRTLRYSDRELELEVEAGGRAFLATSETYFPGWRAWIDGRETDLVMTNAAFRGLAVPAGRHRVRMRFEPRVLWYGAAISAVALLLLFGGLFVIHDV